MKINSEKLEPIISNKQGTVGYDRANRLFLLRAEGIPNVDLIKELMEAVIVWAKNDKVICGVTDLTKIKGTFTAANSYLKDRFVPAMMPLGYKYVGLITPDNPFTKFAANTMIGLFSPKGLKLKMFSNLNDCEEWISEQEEYKVS